MGATNLGQVAAFIQSVSVESIPEGQTPAVRNDGTKANAELVFSLPMNSGAAAQQSAASALVSEGWAKGEQSGTPVQSGTYYHDNAKYYKEQAAQSASNASTSETNAGTSETNAASSASSASTNALKAEGYAVGTQNGTAAQSGDDYYHDNAKYYKEQAATSAAAAASSESNAEAAASAASAYASIILIASGTVGQQKTVTLPSGYEVERQALKVVFPVGHATSTDTAMTLNGTVVVANKNGTLTPLARHQLTTGTYSVLQANTVLELYYTADYDGNSTPAFVVVGNPVVLSSSDYTIYADGWNDNSMSSYNYQSGTSTASYNAGQTFTDGSVTLPKQMPDTDYVIVVRFTGAPYGLSVTPTAKSVTSFTWRAMLDLSPVPSAGTTTIDWQVFRFPR